MLMRTRAAAVAVVLLGLAACSSGSTPEPAPTSATASPSSSPLPRPVSAATFRGPLTAGKGISLLSAADLTSSPAQKVTEYVASGTALRYVSAGEPADGRWVLKASGSAAYRTRVIVRTPADPARYNGTVDVEWLNVSAGADSGPEYTYAADELKRGGYAYVGVSAQQVGIDGSKPGDIASQLVPGLSLPGLRQADPARYGSLRHPGDAYSYDIFTQVALGLRQPGTVDVLGGLKPARVIALGESQSAARLTTYVNGVQPLTRAFDGFFIHSRGGGAAPLSGAGNGSSVVDGAYRIRTDSSVPVLVFETETDISLLRYDRAEQPDGDRFRLWEVAGTAHSDTYAVGTAAGSVLGCGNAINSGPQHYVVKAAVAALDRWVRTGTAPLRAPRFEHTGPVLARDSRGIVLGGIRTPAVDVPIAVESGEPGSAKPICALLGSSKPFPPATLTELYGSPARYVGAYDRSAAGAVSAGHVLAADLPALQAEARKVTFPAA